jgi:hypothetical protein
VLVAASIHSANESADALTDRRPSFGASGALPKTGLSRGVVPRAGLVSLAVGRGLAAGLSLTGALSAATLALLVVHPRVIPTPVLVLTVVLWVIDRVGAWPLDDGA